MTVTPEELLAGLKNPNTPADAPAAGTDPGESGNPNAPGNPGAPDMSTGVSPSIGDQLRTLAGVPGNPSSPNPEQDAFRQQVAKNANAAIKTASDPSAPFAWARSLVAGAQTALAGVGNIGEVPKGTVSKLGGALYGIGKVAQANAAADDRQKQEAAAAKQQKFENDYKTQELEMRKQTQSAEQAANLVRSQRDLHALNKEAQDDLFNSTAPWREAAEKAGQEKIQDGLTSADITDLKNQHKSADDPNGTKWAMDQNIRQTGWQANTNADGIETGTRRATYSMFTWGDPLTVNKGMEEDAKNYLQKNITEGTVLDPQDARSLEMSINKAKVDEKNGLEALAVLGKTKDEIAAHQKNQDFSAASATLTPWVTDAARTAKDPSQAYGLAMSNMAEAAAEKGPDGKPTQHALDVQKQYDLVQRGLGPEVVKDSMKLYNDAAVAQVKANVEAAKNDPLKVGGDASLSGDAYLKSLPAQEQPIMRGFVNGQLGFPQMQRLLSGKDGQKFISEAFLVDPSLNGPRMGALPKVVQDYTAGPTSKAINAGATAIDSLKRLNDLSTKESLIPGTDAYNRRQDQLVTTATEVQKFINGGNGQPTEQEVNVMVKKLGPGINPLNRTSGLLQQAKTIGDKYRQYKQEWDNALPNESWQRAYPMPGMSAEALANAEYLDAVGSGVDYKTAEAARKGALNSEPKSAGGNLPKSVLIGGNNVPLSADGLFKIGNDTYHINPDGKGGTLIPPEAH